MGTDIHFFVEKRENDEWVSCDKWDTGTGYPISEFYDNRNYSLFAILANVRNGYGFADCDTGDGFIPIAKPRGLPSDMSPYVKHYMKEYEGDLHSRSWFTLKELLEYPYIDAQGNAIQNGQDPLYYTIKQVLTGVDENGNTKGTNLKISAQLGDPAEAVKYLLQTLGSTPEQYFSLSQNADLGKIYNSVNGSKVSSGLQITANADGTYNLGGKTYDANGNPLD